MPVPQLIAGRVTTSLVTAFAVLVTVATFTPRAEAYVVEPVVADNIPTIAQHVARGGAVEIPGVGCGTVCSDWWLAEHRPIPGQPSSAELHRELRSLRTSGARVLPALRTLGTIGLVAGTFTLGWKIGEGIRTRWLGIEVPARGTTAGADCGGRYGLSLQFYAANSDLHFGARTDEDGWVWQFGGFDPACGGPTNRWFGDNCQFTFPDAPAPFETRSSSNSIGMCKLAPFMPWSPSGTVNPVKWGFLPENGTSTALSPSGPVEDYVDQPHTVTTTNWTGAPTSQTQLQDRVRLELETGDFQLTEHFYGHLLDERNIDAGTEADDPCALGDGGTNQDPGESRGTGNTGTEFALRYELAPATEYPPTGLPTIDDGQVHMRWGVAEDRGNPYIDWWGWGYRKIKAKHGWSSQDLEATQVALLNPLEIETAGGRKTYWGPEYAGTGGATCQRVVVVDTEPRDFEVSAGMPAAGITNSYGRLVSGASG